MKKFGLGVCSALVLSSAAIIPLSLTVSPSPVRAQGFVPNAPFVTAAGVIRGDRHYIEVAVAAFDLNGLIIECTNLAGVRSVDVTNQFGESIQASSSVSGSPEGGSALTINFNEPINPGNQIRIVMNGVEQQRDGGGQFYRVSAETGGIPYPFPVGTARLIERDTRPD